MNSVFSRICLVPHVVCCLMMAGCTVESMIHGYHKYIGKLSLESELDLLKYCNINILTSILTQNQLKHTSHCFTCLMLQNRKIGKNFGELEVIHQIRESFSLQSFLLYNICHSIYVRRYHQECCTMYPWELSHFIYTCWQMIYPHVRSHTENFLTFSYSYTARKVDHQIGYYSSCDI